MTTLREAEFYETRPGGRVLCTLCPHRCNLAAGHRGACGVRVNHDGRLVTLVYDRVAAAGVDPIEKKPLFHFLPGSLTYSIATVGCCLRCAGCQNWELAHWAKEHVPLRCLRPPEGGGEGAVAGGDAELAALQSSVPGQRVTPEEIVEAAVGAGCRSVAYTYTEPTVFFELAFDTAVRARQAGLRNVLVTSGYTSEAPLRRIAGVLDAVNVDLKSFRDETYRRATRGRLGPVLDAIRLYRALGVWTEVTTLVVPGLNDTDDELRQIAAFLRSLGEEVPWHVTRFHPAYRARDRGPTPLDRLRRARQIGIEAGLRYVYEGNVPGEGGEDTRCHACGALLVARFSVFVRANRIGGGCCPDCGARVEGVGMDGGA